jgi:hypothetical protein
MTDMSNRGILIMTLLTVVAVTGYNLRQSEETTDVAARPAGSAPAIAEAPSLRTHVPKQSAIANLDVWNMKPVGQPGQLPQLKELFKPFYTLSNTGRFEAVQRSDRPNEQWQFQGVVMRGDAPRALFYNAGLKKLKNLGLNDSVDEKLVISRITTDSVTLKVLGEKKPLSFQLHIFNANKDLYVAKRKKP